MSESKTAVNAIKVIASAMAAMAAVVFILGMMSKSPESPVTEQGEPIQAQGEGFKCFPDRMEAISQAIYIRKQGVSIKEYCDYMENN